MEIVFPEIEAQTLEVRMSRSSPGRYRLHDFARNVYSFRAFDGSNNELEAPKADPWGWSVAGHDGTVRVRYTVFGDHMSGTYSAIDETHAHLNPPSVLAWARGLEDRPVEVRLAPADARWRAATQLEPTDDPLLFRAPDLDYLLDSPIELSDFVSREWTVGTGDSRQRFRMAVHHTGSPAQIDAYVEWTKRVVAESAAVFGELPSFDFGEYSFLVDYLPWASGDAMEHRNSTPLVSASSLERDALELVSTLSHEFFHVWNVERLRPRSLEPFAFDGVTFSEDLWFSEGFTNYYDGLLLVRAGVWGRDDWAGDLSVTVDRILSSSAPRFGSALDVSRLAVFRDRGRWVDPQNTGNTYLHYYFWGESIALALDLELRSRFETDLDHYMRNLWERFGRGEVPFVRSDLEEALAEISNEGFARTFFERYVEGREVADYARLLATAGYEVRPENPDEVWIGHSTFSFGDGGARVNSMTRIGSPLYAAGVDRGDVIVSIEGRKLRSARALQRALSGARPGDELSVVVTKRDGLRTVRLRVAADPTLEVVSIPGPRLTPEQTALRADWLGSKSTQ